jgi:hypothetical protein
MLDLFSLYLLAAVSFCLGFVVAAALRVGGAR